MHVGRIIASRRKDLNFSQGTFAAMVGITQNYLSQIENGRREPTISILKAIASHLRLPLPVVFFLAMDEEDVKPERLDDFRSVYPKLQSLVTEVFEQ